MNTYPILSEYRDDDGDPKIAVNITVTTEADVDPHEAINALIDTTRDLIEAIHRTTDCVAADPAERAAALAAMFLQDDDEQETDRG